MRTAKTILIALPNIGNPFYSTILDAVVNEAASRGYGVLVASHIGEDPSRWLNNYFYSNRADGMLLFDGGLDTRAMHAIPTLQGRLPLIAAYDELPDPELHSVCTDNLLAAERAMQHLQGLGHRRIGHVAGLTRNRFPNERLVGFRKAMFEAGLDVARDWVLQGDYSMASGAQAGHRFAELPDRPTAMFIANDEMAIGFISAVREHGLDCPRDVSVIGFDDIAIARHYAPPLTTMRQPREQIGRVATEALIDILEGTPFECDPLRIVLTSELVVRESAAPHRG
jgi:LacI family repressor for deo operon, udp, cdd, tsx, nupC, and nupG